MTKMLKRLKFSANLSTLFPELPLVDRFAAAARAGFDAVEVWFPYEIPAEQMRDILRANGQVCVGINSPAGDAARTDWGLAVDSRRQAECDASVDVAMRYAQAIDCPCVHVMAGQLTEGLSFDHAWQNYLACIERACRTAERFGRTVMIEPLNVIDRPKYILSRQAQALDVIATLDYSNLKIMLDLFHLQRGEGNLIERIRQSLPHAAHVQIADNPGRHQPGTGEIHFDAVF
jgi:hydroxypyruvate isomerase